MKKLRHYSFTAMVPNITTLVALCSGMTSIHFALQNLWKESLTAFLVAAILDGLDGRLARLLKSSSQFGAELDSFSDLISFGLCPGIVLYLKELNNWGNAGWALVLFYTACMTLRLARFNVSNLEGSLNHSYFTGMPAPIAAYIVLLPLIMEQCFKWPFLKNPNLYAALILICGLMIVSKIPTFSLKKISIPPRWVKLVLLGIIIFAAFLYVHPWFTLSVFGVIYLFSIPFSAYIYRSKVDY